MATRQEDLYAEDYYAWTRDQAAALRRLAKERWNGPLDLTHLAAEVEDSGNEVRSAVRSQLRRLIEQCLKLEHAKATDPRSGWMRTVANARAEIADRVTFTIRRDVEADLQRVYTQARREAALGLVEHGSRKRPTLCRMNGPTPSPSSSMMAGSRRAHEGLQSMDSGSTRNGPKLLGREWPARAPQQAELSGVSL